MSVGTNIKYYIQNGTNGSLYDVTPLRTTTTAGEVTFAATNGSKTITVTDVGHGAQAGDFVTYSGAVSLGGNITASILNAEFQVATYISSSQYTITASVAANSSDSGNGGAAVVGAYQITTGNAVYTQNVGWGAGGWSGVTTGYTSTGWGAAAPAGLGIGVQLRLWSESNYGEDLIFNPRGGALYYWANAASPNTFNRGQLLGPSASISTKSGTLTVDAYCPSVANIVMVSDASRFVIAFGCNDAVASSSVQNPMFVAWSDQEDITTWLPSATNQAGSYTLSHGSQIIAAIQTRQEILVLTDAAIYSMQYLGPPYVWGFQLMGDNISIAGPNAVATANNVTYWMGTDKFYMYSGRVETLPCSLRQYVYDDINLTQSYQFFASTNEGYSEVWFFYCSISGPDGSGTPANPNTTVDRYVIFNHLERTWYYGTMARTYWIDSPLRATPMSAGYANAIFTGSISGTTLTVTNITAGALNIGSIITGTNVPSNAQITALGTGTGGVGTYTINYSATVASESMVGLPAVNCGSLIYQENGADDGTTNPPSPITAYVQSSDFDIGDGHNFGLVTRIIPDVTFDGSTVNNPSVDFTVRPRQFPGTNYGTADSPTVTSTQNYLNQRYYTVQQFTEQVFVRVRGRQMAFKISSNDLGVAWQLGTPRIDTRPDGRR